MPHSPYLSAAPAAASSDCLATDSCPEAELESPVNEYGYRYCVTQKEVHQLLERAGVVPRIALAELQPYSGVLAEIQDHARQASETVSLYRFKGADVPALFPASLGKYPVWYIRLPDTMAQSVAQFVQFRLGVCAGYTDDPWVLACYLQIASQEFTAHDEATEQSADAMVRQGLEVCTDWVCGDIDLAAQKGCVLVIYECAGRLTLTGYALDEDMLMNQQALESSTFFNPARVEPRSELQARTRAVEDTGKVPHAWGSVSVRISDVFGFDQSAPADAPLAGPREKTGCPYAQTPGVSAYLMGPAVVGPLGKVLAYVPPELLRDQQVWLRSTVTPEFFQLLRDNECQAWVERVRLAREEGDAFVVVVRSHAQLTLIVLKADDARFGQAYEGWAGAGGCALAIENTRNGRMLALPLAWPREFTGSAGGGNKTAAELQHRPGQRASGDYLRQNLRQDRAARDVAERLATSEGLRLTCGFSEAIDEFQWAIDSQSTW